MRQEIKSASHFIASLLKKNGVSDELLLTQFEDYLMDVLIRKYENHWFEENPARGSGFRCLRMNRGRIESSIAHTASAIGLNDATLRLSLPAELTLWIDPHEVSFRIGEEGSIGILYQNLRALEALEKKRNAFLIEQQRSYSPPQPYYNYYNNGDSGYNNQRYNNTNNKYDFGDTNNQAILMENIEKIAAMTSFRPQQSVYG